MPLMEFLTRSVAFSYSNAATQVMQVLARMVQFVDPLRRGAILLCSAIATQAKQVLARMILFHSTAATQAKQVLAHMIQLYSTAATQAKQVLARMAWDFPNTRTRTIRWYGSLDGLSKQLYHSAGTLSNRILAYIMHNMRTGLIKILESDTE